jgi:hypothetical protein
MAVLDHKFAVGCGSGTDYPSIYISVYTRTNRCYNRRVLESITFVAAHLTVLFFSLLNKEMYDGNYTSSPAEMII